MHESTATPNSGAGLWRLIALAAAICLWVGADELRLMTEPLELQQQAAAARVQRGSAVEISARKEEARLLEAARQQLQARLLNGDSDQMVRAKLVYDLRQKCELAHLSCTIRLAEQTGSANLSASQQGKAGDELAALGVARARAILQGSFKTDEVQALYQGFATDTSMQWKVNGVVVKGNSFEMDVERLVMRPPTKS